MSASWKSEAAEKLLNNSVKKLHSNQAINSAFEFVGQGAANAYRFGKEAMSNPDGIVAAAETVFKDGDAWNYGRIAGSYIAVSSAARIATGGGLTRDRNGNNNIIGIPGI